MTEGLVLNENGARYLKIVEASDGNRHEHYLKEGEITSIHNILFTLNQPQEGAVNIRLENGLYFIQSPFSGNFLRMADQFEGTVAEGEEQPLQLRALYRFPGFQFVIPEPALRGTFDWVKAATPEQGQDALTLRIASAGDTATLTVAGGKGRANPPTSVQVGGLGFYVQYGSLPLELPFAIRLNDFIAEKYPGTEKSYASFMSKVTVQDQESFDYDIFMNHVLDHRGYRFFQSSFDPDEKGTVLSVNHDWWGTWITYAGYILLFLSMTAVFFVGNTRFKSLSKALEKMKQKKALLTVVTCLTGTMVFSQKPAHSAANPIHFDSIIQAQAFDKTHAAQFGKVVIQDFGGRMKPANTFSSELLRKVSKYDTYKGLNSDQVLLSIMNSPALWYNVPFVYLSRGNDSLRTILGIGDSEKYASLLSFFDTEGNYKIAPQLEAAYRAGVPNKFQKDFIEVDRRVNLLYSALEGKIMRIFPIPNDANNKWVSYPELQEETAFSGQDSLYVHSVLPFISKRCDWHNKMATTPKQKISYRA